MSNPIVLSPGIRSNLLTLQQTAEMQAKVQERLATGKKVNSALDNPTNFFTAAGLNRRAADLGSLLDAMSNGIKTLQAADTGMTSITKVIDTMRAYAQQARQDKSFKGVSYTVDAATIGTTALKNISFSGGAVGATAVDVALNTTGAGSPATAGTLSSTFASAMDFDNAGDQLNFSVAVDGGAAQSISISQADVAAIGDADNIIDDAAELRAILTAKSITGVTIGGAGANVTITSNTTGASSSVAISSVAVVNGGGAALANTSGLANGSNTGAAAVSAGAVRTVDQLVTDINATVALQDKIRASNDGGRLRIENLSTEALTVTGASATTVDGAVGSTNPIGGNEVRRNLITQFNDLRAQLDKIANDSSFNGVNLLRGDKLKVVFNEISTSILEIQAKDSNGVVRPISTEPNSLNIAIADAAEFSSDAAIDLRLQALADALIVVRTQASSFGANLATVQIRQEFSKQMINTLNSGADNLVLADSNEEGANLLALNTRQQLSQTALALASQASQAVLRLFG